MKVRYIGETGADFTNGKIYEITNKGLTTNMPHTYRDFLEEEGDTLLDKWNNWDGTMDEFEQLEEDIKVSVTTMAHKIESKNIQVDLYLDAFYVNDMEFKVSEIDELIEVLQVTKTKIAEIRSE